MLLQFGHQIKKFSYKNWWVFLFLLGILGFVYFTSTGNIYEIFILFLLNLLGALFMMMMQDSYKDSNFSIGSVFLLFANIVYGGISFYGYFVNNEVQYLLWQISFNLSGFQLLLKDVWGITIRWINLYTIFPIGIIIMIILIGNYNISLYGFIQSLGFLCVTSGLVVGDNIKRYYILFLGTTLIVGGSFLGIYLNYLGGEVLGITVGYGLIGLVTLLYYIKIFPKYYHKLI